MKWFLSLLLGPLSLLSDEPPAKSDDVPGARRFLVAPAVDNLPEFAPQVLIVLTDEHRFAVTVPPQWVSAYDNEMLQLTLRQPNLDGAITIRFSKAPAAKETDDTFLKHLRERYRESEILDRPSLTAFSTPAIAFDLRWNGAHLERFGRFACVEQGGAKLEFSLVTSPQHFETHLAALMQVMATLRMAAANDKVELPNFGLE